MSNISCANHPRPCRLGLSAAARSRARERRRDSAETARVDDDAASCGPTSCRRRRYKLKNPDHASDQRDDHRHQADAVRTARCASICRITSSGWRSCATNTNARAAVSHQPAADPATWRSTSARTSACSRCTWPRRSGRPGGLRLRAARAQRQPARDGDSREPLRADACASSGQACRTRPGRRRCTSRGRR